MSGVNDPKHRATILEASIFVPPCGKVALLAFLLWLQATTAVLGATVVMQFTASNLNSYYGNAVPVDPVSGRIVWQAVNLTSPVQSFVSIDLTIGGHTYSVNEIGFLSDSSYPMNQIGGLVTGVNALAPFTDDFNLSWNPNNFVDSRFGYTMASVNDFYSCEGIQSLSLSEAPEPGPAPLTIVAILCLVLGRGVRCRTAVPSPSKQAASSVDN